MTDYLKQNRVVLLSLSMIAMVACGGASAPEELVQNFISEIKESMNVSIEEIVTANEKVVFKLPKEVN